MKHAAEQVISRQLSLCEAAKTFSIPKTTLFRYCTKLRRTGDKGLVSFCPNYSVRRICTDSQESLIAEYLLQAAKLHHRLSSRAARSLAFDFAAVNNIQHPINWIVNQAASEDWLLAFMKRHAELSLRTPEPTSLSRATSFNKSNVGKYFDNLEDVIQRYGFGPHQVYNVDETGVTTVHHPQKISASRGSKQVGKVTSGERGTLITLCVAVNAVGNSVPPMFIFPRVYFKDPMLNGAPVGSKGVAHPSGWMTIDLFAQYLKHFAAHVRCNTTSPVLLLLDNHDSHISIESITYAKENDIVLLTFPPHCSHKLQPLDRSVFGPLKRFYNNACDSWMLQNPGKPMTIFDVAAAVGSAFPQAVTPRNIEAGFQVSGNWPVNRDVFTEDEYLSSYVTDRPNPEEMPSNTTSTTSQEPVVLDKSPVTTSGGPLLTLVSPEQLKPFPKAGARKPSSRVSRTGKTRILTDTPVKAELEQMAKNKKPRMASSRATKKLKFVKHQNVKVSDVHEMEDVEPTQSRKTTSASTGEKNVRQKTPATTLKKRPMTGECEFGS